MKIEYLTEVNPAYPSDSILRIFDFDYFEACQFREILSKLANGSVAETDLSNLPFVTSISGCRLILKVGSKDKGIVPLSGNAFECILTRNAWQDAESFVEPFCDENPVSGYQWLYDLDNDIELLFSKNGDW
jgi:hypothetical protein